MLVDFCSKELTFFSKNFKLRRLKKFKELFLYRYQYIIFLLVNVSLLVFLKMLVGEIQVNNLFLPPSLSTLKFFGPF